jgi:formamidopyrimidine-DNA glycosylase
VPEQPEVERAVVALRAAAVGRRIADVVALHPTTRRALDEATVASLRGRRIAAVERRGKHQFVRLDDGRTLHVHFRMAGDWSFDRAADPPPRNARALLVLDDGSRVALVDPRALATIAVLARDAEPAGLGPEADDPALTPAVLRDALRRRRGPIKPVLLDQRVVAGIGNIYAAEALWHARISPTAPASSLGPVRVARLLDAIRLALAEGARAATRYTEGPAEAALAVYGREGAPCRRCGGPIRRIAQAGRSTYYCPRCQPR